MGLINDYYSTGEVVINIRGEQFGGLLKMGDLIATLNVLAYMRNANKNPNIKFYIPNEVLQPKKDYVITFRDFLIDYSDYISTCPGSFDFDGFVEIWSFRELYDSIIRIDDSKELNKKICIFPLIDASYNGERNWSNEFIQNRINEFSTPKFYEYEKIICIKDNLPEVIDVKEFNISHDFKTNLNHLLDCEYFIGGDTGTSHLVSIFDNPNKKLKFYYNFGYHGGWLSSFTKPFDQYRTNTQMIYYNDKLTNYEPKLHTDVLSYLITYRPFNPKVRFGIKRDGGYVVVDNYKYDFFISGGVGTDVSFEFDFIEQNKISGVVLDGTVEAPNLPKGFCFVKKNIGSINSEYTSNLVEYIQNYKNIFLKLDVEGAEWDLFTSEFSNHLDKIKQMTIELHHIFSDNPKVLQSLELLSKTHHLVHIHENNNCQQFFNIGGNDYPETFELTFLRKDCRVRGLNDIPFPVEGLDYPNANYPNHNLNFYPFVVN
jgi:hypothetical protein